MRHELCYVSSNINDFKCGEHSMILSLPSLAIVIFDSPVNLPDTPHNWVSRFILQPIKAAQSVLQEQWQTASKIQREFTALRLAYMLSYSMSRPSQVTPIFAVQPLEDASSPYRRIMRMEDAFIKARHGHDGRDGPNGRDAPVMRRPIGETTASIPHDCAVLH